jgi:hypothetical protein
MARERLQLSDESGVVSLGYDASAVMLFENFPS